MNTSKTRLWFLKITCLICLGFNSGKLVSQIPDTEIFLVDMTVTQGVYTFGEPVNIAEHKGYDNQPCFAPQGNMLYYVSMQERIDRHYVVFVGRRENDKTYLNK